MVLFGTRSHGTARRRVVATEGAAWHKGEWIEASTDPHGHPASFLLEQPANATLEAHFHRNNQFQVFIQGGGRIGKRPIGPVTVHYAGAFTAYGPLVAGPHGLKYFTFRNAKEDGFIPVGRRELMVAGPKRHAQAAPWEPAGPLTLQALRSIERHELIALGEDGLAAYVLRLPAHAAPQPTPVWPVHLGRFLFVLAGELHVAGRTLGVWEHLYANQGCEPMDIRAGCAGAELLCLQLPSLAEAYAI